jgi:hypothetical protein
MTPRTFPVVKKGKKINPSKWSNRSLGEVAAMRLRRKNPGAPSVLNPAMAQRTPVQAGPNKKAVVQLGSAQPSGQSLQQKAAKNMPVMSNKGGANRGADRVAQLAQLKSQLKHKRGNLGAKRSR